MTTEPENVPLHVCLAQQRRQLEAEAAVRAAEEKTSAQRIANLEALILQTQANTAAIVEAAVARALAAAAAPKPQDE